MVEEKEAFLRKAALLFAIILFTSPVKYIGQNIFINEFLASNVTENPEMDDFGEYPDWIEIYNAENNSVDLSGYYLTDNLNIPTKWQIPDGTVIQAKGMIRFWADGKNAAAGSVQNRSDEPRVRFTTKWNHTNFKLSLGGEEIGLFDREGTKLDSIKFGLQYTDVSYGRKPDGTNNWYYFGEPSPAEPNMIDGVTEIKFTSEPVFSVKSGLYNSSQNLVLSNESAASVIRYTTNGSKPKSSSRIFSSNILIAKTTVVKARVFESNKLPGKVITQSYIINEDQTLPVLSISADSETLFGPVFGIYSNSIKGREVPASFDFFEPNGTSSANFDGGLRISGQAAFQYPQKPITISAKDKFGVEPFNYQFFPNRNVSNYYDFYLRNSGTPDNRHTMFRDALQHSLVINQMDIDCQAYRPVMSFINGNYWGIYNLREKLNAEHLAVMHNIDPNNIDYLEYDFDEVPVEIEGDANEYNELLNFIRINDLSITDNYNYVESKVDINEFLNYQITEIFCDNVNWSNTNMRWWKEKGEKGKWRWVLLDLDWGFGTDFPGFASRYTNNTLKMATSAPGSLLEDSPWATELFRNLLKNQEFQNEFIQRFAGYLNTTFSAERTLHITDSIKTMINAEMGRHINRWNNNPSLLIFGDPPIMNTNEWNRNVEVLRTFAKERTRYQRNHIVDFFNLSGTAKLRIINSNSDKGRVIVNNVKIPNNLNGLYFKDIPLTLKAIPAVGYRFIGWEGKSNSTLDSISFTLEKDEIITANFEAANVSIIPSEINSNITLTKSNSPYYSISDVNINAGATLSVEPGVEILMSGNASINVFGKLLMDGTELNPIRVSPNGSSGFSNWGAVCFINSNELSQLSHVKLSGATSKTNEVDFIGAISSYKSNLVLENIEILDAPFPIFIQYGTVELRNSRLHSEKTSDLINVKYATSATIENCLFKGNNSYDTDAIDFDGITNGVIRGNRIYNFFGDNSDGIDLGENSINILIKDNLIYNCSDKGISVGQASTANIENNVIVNCAQGVGVKDYFSLANIIKTTFYKNDYAVASFEKNFGAGGGNISVKNSILSNSIKGSYFLDNLSELEISYSLSDIENLPGTGNIFSEPNFSNNFNLTISSPAINSGDPLLPKDSDGSITDMGAFSFSETKNHSLIFNEIHFNPIEGSEYAFIELFNSGETQIDLTGYKIKGDIEFQFPAGQIISPNEYMIIAKNRNNYLTNSLLLFNWDEGELNRKWFDLELYNNSNELVDLVSFTNLQEVTNFANGVGPSLELKNSRLENLYVNNWQPSATYGGSPGVKTEVPLINEIYFNEIMAINSSTYQDENGKYSDWIEIFNKSTNAINIGGLYITDRTDDSTYKQIPVDAPNLTTIGPKGHTILWADEDVAKGVLHLDFKLNGEGETLKIAQKINGKFLVIDSVTYPIQEKDISYARNKDGIGEWEYNTFPTPNKPNDRQNIFNRGILLVNGVSSIYNTEITEAYSNNAFSGKFPITFWDCFDKSEFEYSVNLPEAIGHGKISFNELINYSTVIWVGNDYRGDLTVWNDSELKDYLEAGGNLVLLSRLGQNFIDQDMMNYLGITWSDESRVTLENCMSSYSGLINLDIIADQSHNDVFETNLASEESKLLFTETNSFGTPKGLGVWKKPIEGGAYKSTGGQFVFISGRPYRYNSNDLSKNMEYILENFFGESENPTSVEEERDIVASYNLYQNYPNPFNPSTTIAYDLVKESKVELIIYNLLGQKVKTLVNELESGGRKTIVWNGKNNSGNIVSSGIYLYRLKIGNWVQNKKMIFMK